MTIPATPLRSPFAVRPMALFFMLVAAFALPFALRPGIDLEVTRLVHHQLGDAFLSTDGFLWPVFAGIPPLVLAVAIAVIFIALVNLLWSRCYLGLSMRVSIFALLSLALGPGVVADAGLKDHWGRARPNDITEFGGTRDFSPAFVPSDQCAENCSFVSGHASAAFYFVTFALLLNGRWRGPAIALALLFGALVGSMRIAQGGHFLSDVIFSGVVVFAVAWVLKAILIDWND